MGIGMRKKREEREGEKPHCTLLISSLGRGARQLSFQDGEQHEQLV
jgi:hypothetical protein